MLEAAQAGRRQARRLSPRPAAPSTARPSSCRRRRTLGRSRSRPTAGQARRPRTTAPIRAAARALASRCATPTSTARARTRSARPAWSRSSAARCRRRQPTIYGDGEQTRDYVYVGDVVAANLAAAEPRRDRRLQRRAPARDVGPGLVDKCSGVARSTPHRPERSGEVRRSALDPARARRELGWERPAVGMAEGLERTLRWVRSRWRPRRRRRRVLPPSRPTPWSGCGPTARPAPRATPAPTCGCSCCTAWCRRSAAFAQRDVGAPDRPPLRQPPYETRDGVPRDLRALRLARRARAAPPAGAHGRPRRWRWRCAPCAGASGSTSSMPTTPCPPPTRRCGARPATPLVVSVHGGDVLGAARHSERGRERGHARTDRAPSSCSPTSARHRRPVRRPRRPRHAGRAPGHRPARAAAAAKRRAATLATLGHLVARKRHVDVLRAHCSRAALVCAT